MAEFAATMEEAVKHLAHYRLRSGTPRCRLNCGRVHADELGEDGGEAPLRLSGSFGKSIGYANVGRSRFG